MAAGQDAQRLYYRRKVNKNSKKSNHTSQNGHSKKSTDNKCSRQLERCLLPPRPDTVRELDIGNSHWKESLCMPGRKKKLSKELILGSDIPTPLLIYFKKTHAPQHSLQLYLQEPRNRSKQMSTDRLSKKWYMYTMDYYSGLKSHHWNYAIGHYKDEPWRIIH